MKTFPNCSADDPLWAFVLQREVLHPRDAKVPIWDHGHFAGCSRAETFPRCPDALQVCAPYCWVILSGLLGPEQSRLRGGSGWKRPHGGLQPLHGSLQLLRAEHRGSVDLCSMGTQWGLREWHRAVPGVGRERFCPRGWWAGISSAELWGWP